MLAVIQDFENHVKAEGRKEERKDITNIFTILFRDGRAEDVRKSVEDPEYMNKIMAEFGIKEDEEDTDETL